MPDPGESVLRTRRGGGVEPWRPGNSAPCQRGTLHAESLRRFPRSELAMYTSGEYRWVWMPTSFCGPPWDSARTLVPLYVGLVQPPVFRYAGALAVEVTPGKLPDQLVAK